MSQPPDVPGPYGPGPTPPEPQGAPGWATPSPGSPPDRPVPYGPPPGPSSDPSVPPPWPAVGPPSAYGPPPGGDHRRFSGGFVLLGMLLSWALIVLPFGVVAGIVGAIGGNGGIVTPIVGIASIVAPVVVGGLLVGRGSPQRRGLGLGLLIGWGLAVIVVGGACVALILALRQAGG